MPTLLLRLAGPMQSWGTRSRFDERDSDLEPSKSGVIGLICAAMGVDRRDAAPVLRLAACRMGVRADREGILRSDFLTAQNDKGATTISRRYYLADAAFLVGLESDDRTLLEAAQLALRKPVWPLALGRKSYVPSPGVHLPDGLKDESLEAALRAYPLLVEHERNEAQTRYRIVLENTEGVGSLRLDEPRSSFAERRFAARYVTSSFVEVVYVPEQIAP